MAAPTDINERRGGDSEIRYRINRNPWYWIAAAVVIVLLALAVLASPGASTDRVAAETANVQGAAPGPAVPRTAPQK